MARAYIIDGGIECWGFEVAVERPDCPESIWFLGVDEVHLFAPWAPMYVAHAIEFRP